jgi:hypothetical protein
LEVVLTTSRTSLIAWPLGHVQTGDPERIRLPGPVMRITAQQDRVGIFTTTYHVLIWSIGGALISVDNSEIYGYLADFILRQGLVVFHPTDRNCFFVIYEAWPKPATNAGIHTRRIIVQEFTEGNLKITKLIDLEASSPGLSPITGLFHNDVVGIFKVFVPQPTAESIPNTIQTHNRSGENEPSGSGPKEFVMVTFDIYRRRFVLERYSLPHTLRRGHQPGQALEQALYWRNQVLLPVHDGNPSELKHILPGT